MIKSTITIDFHFLPNHYFSGCEDNSHVNNLIGAKSLNVKGWNFTAIDGGTSVPPAHGYYVKDCGSGKKLKSMYLFLYQYGSNAPFNLKIFVLQTKRGLDITVETM